jgi:hypothetical protein
MHIRVPGGVESLARSGANPIRAEEIVDRLRSMALGLQRRCGSAGELWE